MLLRARRGGVLVFVAVAMTALMAMAAFAIELSRMMAVASEAQVAADAAALAGVAALVKVRNGTYVDSANVYSAANKIEGQAGTASYTYGTWNSGTGNVDASTYSAADAVRASISVSRSQFFGGLAGRFTAFNITRAATAWGGGSLNSSGCLKPWVVSYGVLLDQVGQDPANTAYNLTEADIQSLEDNGPSNLVTIKFGSGSTADITGGSRPFPAGFAAVGLPPINRGGKVSPSSSDYQANIEDTSCTNTVAIGDQLRSANGNMTGATSKGLSFLCLGNEQNGKDFDCPTPYPITLAVYSTVSGGDYTVKLLASFMATGYRKPGSVLGYFSTFVSSDGGFSSSAGPVRKLVLVK